MVIPALIVCVGILNAFNFMDGINGITGGYALSVIIPIIYLNQKMQFINMPFLIVTAISLLVFCFFNFTKKAKCFAGDVGSVSIAVIVIFGLGRLIMATKDPVYLLFIAVYGADSILTIVHRIMLHENLGVAHRKTANTATSKADLFLAGIIQLLCVLLAGALHDKLLFRRIRRLAA